MIDEVLMHNADVKETNSRPRSSVVRLASILLLILSCSLLASHWLHLEADSQVKIGLLHVKDGSGDLFTDEGWSAGGAIHAVLNNHWYLPKDFNLAVDAPLWSAVLYVPFKLFGVSIKTARAISTGCYCLATLFAFLFVRRYLNQLASSFLALILASNVLAMTFTRTAFTEAAWFMLLMASLLVSQISARRQSLSFAFLAGILIGLSMLTKLTAVFGVAPIVFVLFLECRDIKTTARSICLFVSGLAITFMPWRLYVARHFAIDHSYYIHINVSGRQIRSVSHFVRHVGGILYTMRGLDGFLCLAVLICMGILIVDRSLFKRNNLIAISLIWLMANIAIFTSIAYFPLRYCVSLLFPVAVLALAVTSELIKNRKPLGYMLAVLLACCCLSNAAESIEFQLEPTYSYLAMCREVQRVAGTQNSTHAEIMGHFANTVSLFTGLPSVNDELGTADISTRIKTFRPAYYLSTGPATTYILQDYSKAGAHLILVGQYVVLDDYFLDKPVYFYAVARSDKLQLY